MKVKLTILGLITILSACNSSTTVSKEKQQKVFLNIPEDSLFLNKTEGVFLYQNKLFNGSSIKKYNNQQTSRSIDYVEGKKHGLLKMWFEDGQISYQANYKNGKLEGKSFGWGKNGEILQEHSYKEGLKEGKAFLSSAFFDVEGNYKAGLPDGKWTWFSGGIWKEGFFAKGKLIGECNILMNSKLNPLHRQ